MISLPLPSLSLEDQVRALRERAGVRLLSDSVIAIRGEDRVLWLAGMVTQDTKPLRAGESRYTAVVHEKGKILADGWVFVRSDEILLVVSPGTAEGLIEHFDRHIIMEDVEVSLRTDLAVLTVQGPGSKHRTSERAEVTFEADRIGWSGADWIIGKVTDAQPVLQALESAEWSTVSDTAWEIARLEAGYPRFGVDFDGQNYVQEAGLTPRAVSFHKGCYVGQEVVCRLEMRGHARRKLASLVIDGTPPAAGTSVTDASDESLGVITSSATSYSLGRSVALAMLKWDRADVGSQLKVDAQAATVVARPSGP
jgi:tRNA-modifying protein YgfZ